MNITEKIAALKSRHKARKRRPWFRLSIGNLKAWLHIHREHDRHHASVKHGTASKNTHPNKWNIRPTKSLRPEARFVKLRTFKHRYNLQ